MNFRTKALFLAVLAPMAAGMLAAATICDFTQPSHHWAVQRVPPHIADARTSADGLAFRVTGEDPQLLGPVMTASIPAAAARVRVILLCAPTSAPGKWQIFFKSTTGSFNEVDALFFSPVGQPPYTRFEAEGPIPPCLRGKFQIRLDPPGGTSSFCVKSLTLEFTKPLWIHTPSPCPPLAIPADTPLALSGKGWRLRHDPRNFGAFTFEHGGRLVESNPSEPLVYLDRSGQVQTLDLAAAPMTFKLPTRANPRLETTVRLADADGRAWEVHRHFRADDNARELLISTEVVFDPLHDSPSPKSILHVPYLTLLADRASAGHKRQALLAGVEYLGDEPSSNQKEIRTPQHDRRIPADHRLSAPIAVLTSPSNWLAAVWAPSQPNTPERPAVVFDSPDRVYHSGAHLLAFWAPAVGPSRKESQLSICKPSPFRRGLHSVRLLAGPGPFVTDALERIVTPSDLPPPDRVAPIPSLELLSHGWLDSGIRDGIRFRHAIGGNFTPGLVADAPFLMRHLAAALARHSASPALAERLRKTADEVLTFVPSQSIGHSSVSHIHLPSPPLVGGNVQAWLASQDSAVKSLTPQLATGKRLWRAPPKGKRNLAETLGSDHCCGFTAMQLVSLLRSATWSGSETAISNALDCLDHATALYRGNVPRGAQPWEMPLHTPDIMASAHLTHCYTLAYMLRPRASYLREARRWAYSGLSMVYLSLPPYELGTTPVGLYSTCAVMGATNWIAPNWIGMPVQWCGLVYASALWDLSRIDSSASAFWRRIATGITTSGVRQTHPLSDKRNLGLLPDSWNLDTQTRNPVPINPGTVQENYAEVIGLPFYAVRALPSSTHPLLLHLAGAATVEPSGSNVLACTIDCWPETPSRAVLTRVDAAATATLNSKPLKCEYLAERRTLVIDLPASAKGRLEFTFTNGGRP